MDADATVEARIGRLEARCRRLAFGCAALGAAALAALASAALAPQPEVVRARGFEVVDAEGKVRAVLGELVPGSTAGLELRSSTGKLAAMLACVEGPQPSGPTLGAALLHLASEVDPEDEARGSVARLWSGPDEVNLALDHAGRRGLRLETTANRTGLAVSEEDPRAKVDRTLVSIGAEDGRPSLALRGRDGALAARLPPE